MSSPRRLQTCSQPNRSKWHFIPIEKDTELIVSVWPDGDTLEDYDKVMSDQVQKLVSLLLNVELTSAIPLKHVPTLRRQTRGRRVEYGVASTRPKRDELPATVDKRLRWPTLSMYQLTNKGENHEYGTFTHFKHGDRDIRMYHVTYDWESRDV